MKKFGKALALLAAFLAWTVAVKNVDVRPIGPMESAVGFASLNEWAHRLTGVNWGWYALTDWLSLVPLAVMAGFGLLGLTQWIRRGKLARVDRDLLKLEGLYAALLGAFVFFEIFMVNCRPVLIDGVLEASYPSSTTMLVLCVMPTAMEQLRRRIRYTALGRRVLGLCGVFTGFMVVGRVLSGVHWITDVIGGILLSGALVSFYTAWITE